LPVSRRTEQLRRWLRGKLKYAAEPSLAERLFETFSSLPLKFDLVRLKKFCEDCQNDRNDISHYGGRRKKDQKYGDFMRDLDRQSDALAALYHFHLLNIIGVDAERLDFSSNHSFPLSRLVQKIRTVGILSELKQSPDNRIPN